ncbi:hypothetical protein V473_07035 [Sphingobium cupriresistens LL01]|uniref:Uncharacterized protein n=1 Tax=Sphingobium cupriresistens LL01 TaxID=1420583 RepID=A0A0J8AWX8_9SPHN|nr:hypothetical protein V473_02515 [Sphingobium cupriresistens LL01]KMS58765.1 hypothetical protein V473_07035 [Sphingobium cupriresistens LL01]
MKRDVDVRLLFIPFFSVMHVMAGDDGYTVRTLGGIKGVMAIALFRHMSWDGRAERNLCQLRSMRFADNFAQLP